MSDELKKLLERYRAATVGLPSDVSVSDIEQELLAWHQQELERAMAEVLDRLEEGVNMQRVTFREITKSGMVITDHDWAVRLSTIQAERESLNDKG